MRDELDARGIPAVINGAGSVFATPAAREWLRLLEALERPASPVPRAGGDDDVVPGVDRGAGRRGVRRGVGGGPPPAARVGRRAAPPRAGVVDRDDHAGRATAGAGARRRRRRAPADRPAPRRPAAPRRRGGGEARHRGAGGVAAPARGGGRAGGRGGAAAAAGVRRGSRPGADDPPQQGARVRSRLRAVPVGADLGRREVQPDRLPRSRLRVPAHDRRRPRRPGLQAPQGPAHLRAARRGPAAGVRRADPRQAPGRDLVGGLVEQPRLGVEPAAVRPRRGRATCADSGARPPSDETAIARFRELASAAPGCISVEKTRRPRRCRPRGPARCRARPASRPRRSRASWTAAGAARPTATSRPRRTRRAWRASRRRRVLDDEPEPRHGRSPRRRPVAARRDPRWRRVRHVRARGARGDRLRRARPRRRAGRDASRRRSRGGRSTVATPAAVVAGLRSALETPLGPLVGGAAAARRRPRADRLDELGFELPLAGGDEPVGRRHAGRDRRRAARAPRARRPAGRLRRPARGSRAAVERARLPDRQHRPRRCAPATRFAVVDYKTNWLGGARRGAARGALPPGRAGRRDGARALPPAGAALHGGAAPLPALAAARLRPGAPPGRRAVPVRARDDGRARSPACSPGGRRRRSSSR